jgi:hypothetical protein
VTRPQPDHPLTEDEIEQFNHFARMWAGDGFLMGSTKTPPLSAELKSRLVQLGEVYGLTVEFPVEPVPAKDGVVQQHFARASKKRPEK